MSPSSAIAVACTPTAIALDIHTTLWGIIFGFCFFWILIKQSVLDRDRRVIEEYIQSLRDFVDSDDYSTAEDDHEGSDSSGSET